MPIIYSLISRGRTVLAEHQLPDATGNFPQVTRLILSKISPDDSGKRTYVSDKQTFHYEIIEGLTYLCLTDGGAAGATSSHRIPFLFLEDIRRRFCGKYDEDTRLSAIAFSLNSDFSPVLESRMDYFDGDDIGEVDAISRVQNEIESVKETMVQNIENILERGEKIELLVESTDRMNQQAFVYERSTRRLERTMYWRKVRRRACYAAILVAVVTIAAMSGCGGINFQRCRSKKN